MVAFEGVGIGGANMEEAGYWLHVLRGHSVAWPLPTTLSLCLQTTRRPAARILSTVEFSITLESNQ